MTTMPAQLPGRSRQDYSTPADFMAAVIKRFGSVAWDLAATAVNAKAEYFITPELDSFISDWSTLYTVLPDRWDSTFWVSREPWLWLNPPFGEIPRWASKCAMESERGARILLLTPASVGANWYRDFVRPNAYSLFLNGRITFEGEEDPYPKDCMLSMFAYGLTGTGVWSWRGEK